MISADRLLEKFLESEENVESYKEFELKCCLLRARVEAKVTQQELAKRMKTSQSQIARMESGEHMPSAKSILKYAKALGKKAELRFV